MGEATPKDLLDCGGTLSLSRGKQYLTTPSRVPTATRQNATKTSLCGQHVVITSSQACCFPTHGINSSVPLFNYTHRAQNIFEVLSSVWITVEYFS